MDITNLDVVENQGGKKKATRVRKGPNKKWTDSELSVLLEFLKNNRKFEKPTAQLYYKNFLEEFGSIVNVEWNLVRFKVRNLKTTYNKAKTWEQSTGAGALEKGQLIKDVLLKMCPNYDDLEEIFGCREAVFQPIVVDTEIEDLDESFLSPTTSNDIEDLVPSRNMTPDANDDLRSISSGTSAASTISQKGIYSRTAVSDILKTHSDIVAIKKQKLDADVMRMEKEITIKEKELLIREREVQLSEEVHRLNQIRILKELELKEKEMENQNNFNLKELEIKERIARQELEMKERIALKQLENK